LKRQIIASIAALSLFSTPAAIAQTAEVTQNAIAQKNATTFKRGFFVSGEYTTEGTARIIEENGKRYLQFDANFRTRQGPDLFAILHRSRNVISSTKPPAHGIKEGDYIVLSALKSINGQQRYAIPSNIDLSEFNSAGVWCRRFNATFGAANLAVPQ